MRGRVARGNTVAHTHTTIWEGASRYTGRPVRAVVKGHVNDKVGKCLGLWVVPAHTHAMDSVRTRDDRDQCGDCTHAAHNGKTCYTHASTRILWNAPKGTGGTLWQTLGGVSRQVSHLRSAVYGDIGALPAEAVQAVRELRGNLNMRPLGYTHAWSTRPDLAADHMASVDSVQEAQEATAKGWRYFRTRLPGAPLLAGEVQCPATPEARRANPITCTQCGLCSGNARPGLPSVSAWRHEPAAKAAGRRILAQLAIGGAQ